MHQFDNLGFARRYRLAVRGRVWTFAGPWERATISFEPSGDHYTETWEIARDGARWRPLCELEATRAQVSREHVVRAYYGAYPVGDRAAVERLLAGGFRFTSPYDDALDAAAYFARCWPGHDRMRSLTIEELAVVGDAAVVTYRLVTRDGEEIRNTERLIFDGDRIASVEVFFGAVRGEDGAFRPMRRDWRNIKTSVRALCYRPARRPPIPVVALVNLLFGIGFALVARDRIRADGPFAAPAFQLVLLHAATIVAPVALYFYAVHPAWSWLYWFDPRKLSGVAVLPLMVGHATLVIGGWYGAAMLLRAGHQGRCSTSRARSRCSC